HRPRVPARPCFVGDAARQLREEQCPARTAARRPQATGDQAATDRADELAEGHDEITELVQAARDRGRELVALEAAPDEERARSELEVGEGEDPVFRAPAVGLGVPL